MCGIYGIWDRSGAPVSLEQLAAATRTLRHRGPDDEGFLLGRLADGRYASCVGERSEFSLPLPTLDSMRGEPWDFAFGFRRLSIVDLSTAGHQPMASSDGRHWMVFNGEVYNYRELRTELAALGFTFRGGSDTEVVLAAFQAWGPACLQRFNGMWGIAVWDTQTEQLFLARDRFGVKPLHYTVRDGRFAFASEIKALVGRHGIPFQPSDRAVFDYLRDGQLPSPQGGETFFAGVQALPGGHCMTVSREGVDVRRFYELPSEPSTAPRTRADVVDEYRSLFEDAIRLRLRADVPIGTCLSGGVDSSSIVCVVNRMIASEHGAAAQVGDRQKTFSAVYDMAGPFNERKHIDTVLAATGAEGNFVVPTAERLSDDLQRLVWHQDEPFGSTSIFAQWCVMSTVRERGVTVLLDGQGADEALAGYRPYDIYAADLLGRGQVGRALRASRDIREVAGVGATRLLMRAAARQLPDRYLAPVRAARRSRASTELRPELVSRFEERPRRYAPITRGLHANLRELILESSLPHLLRYEDRNSMAFSVEGRVPFLDYRLVEFSLREAFRWCIEGGWTKWVLRESMRGIAPEPILWRRDKVGFETPERPWLQRLLSEGGPWFGDDAHVGRYLDLTAAREAEASWQAIGGDDRRVWRWVSVEAWLRAFA